MPIFLLLIITGGGIPNQNALAAVAPVATSPVFSAGLEIDGKNKMGAGPIGFEAVYAQFADTVEVFRDGDTMVIRTKDIPNHNSPYFHRGDSRYEEPRAGMRQNPNRITAQSYEFRVPLNPSIARRPTETRLDAIGVAVNGVVFFNQYAGRTPLGFLPLDREIISFDQYNGHPARRGNYHYHLEPTHLTKDDSASLIGVMLDGFPIYGTTEANGATPEDLDDCNGHTHATPEFPNGVYHYHVTDEAPYLCGCYKGEPGSVTN